MNKWIGFVIVLVSFMIGVVWWQGKTAVAANGNTSTYLPLITNNYDSTLAPIFGIQMYGNTKSDSPYYSSLLGTKANWVRNAIRWDNVEPINVPVAAYNWSSVDTALAVANPALGGLKLIGTIEYAPDWAAPEPNAPLYNSALDDFAEFVGALVERYDGDGIDDVPGSIIVSYWEFYNEPDNSGFWGYHGNKYASMLATIYPVVKVANPNAQVVLGGLAYDWFESNNGPFVESFLDDVLQAGGGNYFDVANFHSYPAFSMQWTDKGGPGLLQKAQHVHAILANHGLKKPIVVTEAGWMSNEVIGAVGSPQVQSRYVVQLFTESMAAGIEAMIWWMLYDPSFPYPHMNGLVTENMPPLSPTIPKMSYYVYQRLVAELGTAHFVRTLSQNETKNAFMEAFLFRDAVNQRQVYVAWLNPVTTTDKVPLSLIASSATVRNSLTGAISTVHDGDDGKLDNKITVQVGADPLYVEVGQ